MNLPTILKKCSKQSIQILDKKISLAKYSAIDLSTNNNDLSTIEITDPEECQKYIDKVLKKNNAKVGYGGYLEKRNLYATSNRFSDGKKRNVHLGLDFWCSAGTKVITPISGIVHSFNNNADKGNYGPTIILKHTIEVFSFYTLYGHLSLESLNGLYVGKKFSKGETLATLGTPDINVNYAPHLHFQLIKDIGNFEGDYPGVCSKDDLDFYVNNCPNPNLLLKLY
ncbi:hypothetical protein MTsPCn9_01320 [Croceitalea sp. MTPC9]|uniref:peptidoglycan DD-metalloendopeptidase family protein n=1 Tax=unclassified Croceitalea TaxID=2632280 RepID=UPI002B39E06A|nr:hypothetical protein MTsPCn6_07390 [Croceitalea sp. MTPC6]GMN15196.1 hypothetical protein MTsPCn9_01320 [Croceitalea sp. MTPC9]